MTRDERQTQALKAWISTGCRGTVLAATGFGKTRLGLRALKWFFKQNPGTTAMVVVPTLYLKTQWLELLKTWELEKVQVGVINSIIKVNSSVDFLIIDEHLSI